MRPGQKFLKWTNRFAFTYAILSQIQDLSRFTCFLKQFGKKDLGPKQYFFASEMHFAVVYIADLVHILSGIYCIYITPNLICKCAQKGRILRDNSKYAADKHILVYFRAHHRLAIGDKNECFRALCSLDILHLKACPLLTFLL